MFKKNCRATAVSRIAAFMAGTRYQMLQMRTVQRGSRQYYAMHQLHRSHASEGMSIVGRVVHRKWISYVPVDIEHSRNNEFPSWLEFRDVGIVESFRYFRSPDPMNISNSYDPGFLPKLPADFSFACFLRNAAIMDLANRIYARGICCDADFNI
nr:PREDICTED: uncharacterized protein LOC105661955 isoform X1 [Megachile rotundata]